MQEIDDVLHGLLAETGASRVTLRQDLPGDYRFPVTHEALADEAGSLMHERTVDLRTQPVAIEVGRGRQVVQDDSAAASDDPAFHHMRETYGGLAAQIVTPILVDGSLSAIVSLHVLGEPRAWSDDDAATCRHAAERVRSLL